VKFFEKEEYADSFLRGELFCNTLQYFNDLEQTGDGRGDPYEGVSAILQPKGRTFKLTSPDGSFEDIVITEKDLAAPVIVRANRNLANNVYCLYAIYIDDTFTEFSDEEISDDELEQRVLSVNRKLKFHDDCYKMGTHAVLIYDVKQFFDALDKHVRDNKIPLRRGLVKYYDENTHDGDFPEDRQIFHKLEKFAHQKEYRLAFRSIDNTPKTLKVGEMSAFAKKIDMDDLRKISVAIRPNEPNE
jgi:hypothetical protein